MISPKHAWWPKLNILIVNCLVLSIFSKSLDSIVLVILCAVVSPRHPELRICLFS